MSSVQQQAAAAAALPQAVQDDIAALTNRRRNAFPANTPRTLLHEADVAAAQAAVAAAKAAVDAGRPQKGPAGDVSFEAIEAGATKLANKLIGPPVARRAFVDDAEKATFKEFIRDCDFSNNVSNTHTHAHAHGTVLNLFSFSFRPPSMEQTSSPMSWRQMAHSAS